MFRMLLQETSVVLDTWFYDDGVTGELNTGWWKSANDVTVTKDLTGITASYSSTSTRYLSPNKSGTSTGSIADLVDWNNCICEFTVHEQSNCKLETRDNDSHVNQIMLNNFNLTDGDKVKLKYTDDIVKVYKNNVQMGSDYTNCSGDVMIRLAINNGSIRFSDFKVYSA